MKIDIDNLTEKELLDLNRRIVERLRFLESMKAHVGMMEFSVGEKVRFRPHGETVVGVLVKYNKKTVTVLTDYGQKWNVSPHLLEKIRKPQGTVDKPGNVIEMNRPAAPTADC